MIRGKPTLCNAKTKWPYFQEQLKTTLDNSISLIIDNDIIGAVESFNYAVQEATWNTRSISSNPDMNIEYSSAIKEKLAEKRKLRKLSQINECPVLKNKLNLTILALENLLNL